MSEYHRDAAIIQTPAVGNALRQALSLDAAGGMPLEMGTIVHPVAMVADVRAAFGTNVRSFSGYRNVGAVAGQYNQFGIGITAAPDATFLYAVPRRATIFAGSGTFVYWRLGLNTPPVGTDAVPRAMNTQASPGPVCSVIGGASATAVSSVTMQGLFWCAASVPREIIFPEMRIYSPTPFGTTAGLNFHTDVANLVTIAEFVWDEYFKA